MKPESFVHYIRGFAETNSNPPTIEQWRIITNQLESVFEKRTPVYTGPSGGLATTGTVWVNRLSGFKDTDFKDIVFC